MPREQNMNITNRKSYHNVRYLSRPLSFRATELFFSSSSALQPLLAMTLNKAQQGLDEHLEQDGTVCARVARLAEGPTQRRGAQRRDDEMIEIFPYEGGR